MTSHFERHIRSWTEGRHFRRRLVRRGSALVVLAPHGGGIEPGTSELAAAIAAERYSLYLFESLLPDGCGDLRITSTRFDDPLALELLNCSEAALALHGMRGKERQVVVGGLHQALCDHLVHALNRADFPAVCRPDHRLAGRSPHNVCNRARSRTGAQLEISAGLREIMFVSLTRRGRQVQKEPFHRFVRAVQNALNEAGF